MSGKDKDEQAEQEDLAARKARAAAIHRQIETIVKPGAVKKPPTKTPSPKEFIQEQMAKNRKKK